MAMCQTLWGAYDHDKWCSLESSYALFNHDVHPLIFHRVYEITIHPLRLRSVTASCMKFSPVNGALLFSFPSLLFSAPSVTSSCNTCHYWSYAPDTCAGVWSPLVVCEELDNSVWIMYCTVGVQRCKVFLGLPLMACFRIIIMIITVSRDCMEHFTCTIELHPHDNCTEYTGYFKYSSYKNPNLPDSQTY